jgi:uncharacterized protein YyaL (SSP411 family)
MPNRLASEASPYLLQHAHNPVDWFPWGDEALALARTQDRPILLSIGYSACHWCHVMERESFEDAAVAEVMNRLFVNIKVDREERPDIDEIYMKAVQAFNKGQGGWPMTVFLTPDGRPFFAGMYFPPQPSRGMPSFSQVMAHVDRIWREHRTEVERVGGEVVAHIASDSCLPDPTSEAGDNWLESAVETYEKTFDSQWGGFGTPPKFPPHGALKVLLAHHRISGQARSLDMLTKTLDGMSVGGMYDLVGGGFARYSVDRFWCIPHFEKMLYDNAQLIPLYVDAWRLTGRKGYARVARQSIAFVLRELTHPQGGFFSALDADSEGEEGLYYVWTPPQLVQVLGQADGERAAAMLEVTQAGNFEHGLSALRLSAAWDDLNESDQAFLDRIFPKLGQSREQRIRPGLDDKIVTAWNGMMISALARAAGPLGEPTWLSAAERAANFLLEHVRVDGRLQRTWKDGRTHVPAVLDDHAWLVQALIHLYEASGQVQWLEKALALAETTMTLFWDEPTGGFFNTGSDAEELVVRTQSLISGAVPSGNGRAALSWLHLGILTERSDLVAVAERLVRAARPLLDRGIPWALGPEMIAGEWLSHGGEEVAVVGPDSDLADALWLAVQGDYHPFRAVARVRDEMPALVPWMADRQARDGRPTAWVCRNRVCQLPVHTADALTQHLYAQSE